MAAAWLPRIADPLCGRAMHLLAISGSLRTRSSNTIVLKALARLAPPGCEVRLFEGLGTLPLFNPDLDVEPLPAPVVQLRALIGAADGVIICSPEYARGVAGALKNALDWLVSSFEFPDKPVALINASQRATDADSALRLTLTTMSARLVEPASIRIDMLGRDLDDDGVVADEVLSARLRAALDSFTAAITAKG
jgi:NAD(P)H-dependent FMN reductase